MANVITKKAVSKKAKTTAKKKTTAQKKATAKKNIKKSGENESNEPFKVLSLDGGGIKGTYTAAVLDQIQQNLPSDRKIIDYFDLIVGTSTGGIIALGLANELTTEQILSIYKDYGPDIFPEANQGAAGFFKWIFEAKHDPEVLKASLRVHFGKRTLSKSIKNVAVTSFDTVDAEPVVFRAGYTNGQNIYQDVELVDIALATSAAPTYFPAAPAANTYMVDGGLWANCPAMVGVVEALKYFDQRRKDIRMLSIGTTIEPLFVTKDQQNGGLADWAKPIPSRILHANKKATISQASDLVGHMCRIDSVVATGRFELDDASAISELERYGRKEAINAWEECKSKYFRSPAKHCKDVAC